MNEAQRANYLERVFTLDPKRDANVILTLRAKAIGLAGKRDREAAADQDAAGARSATAAGPDPALRRAREAALLEAIRSRFFGLGRARLVAALERASRTKEPDLRAWLKRLARAFNAKKEFALLEKDRAVPRSMRDLLETLAVAPPDEAARLSLRRLDRVDLATARATARRVRKHYPKIHTTLPDFFARLQSLKRERRLTRPTSAVGVIIVIYFIFKFILLWCRAGNE